MKSTDPTIVIQTNLDASIGKTWSAITVISEMTEWYFDNIPAFEPIVGFETTFAVSSDERVFTHQWKVTEVEPLKVITYQWKYKEYDGCAYVTFEILSNGDQNILRLRNRITEDFPSDIPEFRRSSCIAGWEYFIKGQLVSYLNR